ncbi:MAG: hypothetical protein AAGA18_16220 [Verrucomicrobiota bacterium]
MDVFGYEKLVNKSIRSFACEVSRTWGVAADEVGVRISYPGETLRVYLHVRGRQVKELTVLELVRFFIGSTTAGMEQKVAASVIRFLDECRDNSQS